MTKVAHPVTTECWTAGAGACDQLLIQSKVILCWAWYSKVLEKENKRLFNVKCAPLGQILASAQPSCTMGRASCSSCDSTLDITVFAELWSFRNSIVFSESQDLWESEKVQDVEDVCAPLLLECNSGWVLFWLAQFYVGVFLRYHGTTEVLLWA